MITSDSEKSDKKCSFARLAKDNISPLSVNQTKRDDGVERGGHQGKKKANRLSGIEV